MSYSYLKTFGGISNVSQIGDKLFICLYKLADISNIMRLCYDTGQEDKAIASAVHEDAKLKELGFAESISKIRQVRKITIPLLSNVPISVIEIYDENDREGKNIKFKLN